MDRVIGVGGASAETLRRAAALMRERAEAVSTEHLVKQTLARGVMRCSCGASSVGNPYWPKTHSLACSWTVSDDDATQVWDERGRLVASAEGLDEAEHIASWHPAVALAVADWLDCEASVLDDPNERGHARPTPALAVARAYLGESA